MKVLGVIPARFGSTRLPGKPLMDIGGKPMVWWVYNSVKDIDELDDVCVATDDARIETMCLKYNIPVVMTECAHRTGANRLQEVSESIEADFYVQINGDEPLIDCNAVKAVIPKEVPGEREFGTNVITRMDSPMQVNDPSNIKMVFDNEMNALYMSRTPIPFPYKDISQPYYKHIGILGYNKKMLEFYKNSRPGRLEQIEGIDTLRFLDYGKQLKLIEVEEYHGLSVDTEKDLEYVRKVIAGKESGWKNASL